MSPKAQGLRSDAERNRQRILEIAQEVFAALGLGVKVEEIAKRAGVGVGTIYRHFPTKEALLQAILEGRMEKLATEAEALTEAKAPGPAFFQMIERFVAEGAAKKDLIAALGGIGAAPAVVARKKRYGKALGLLLARAQEAGVVRGDVDLHDILSLLKGVLADPEATARSRKRRVAVLCDGLRHPGKR